MNPNNILLVEDDVSLRFAIESFLVQQSDLNIKSVGDVEAAKRELEKTDFDIVLSDVKMPGGSGYDLLEHIKLGTKKPLVVLMTAYGTIEQAVTAMKSGAYDFIVKPFQLTTLERVLRGALQDKDSFREQQVEKKFTKEEEAYDKLKRSNNAFITRSPKMEDLLQNIKKIAASKATVLIQGESGTGKEVLANLIHEHSPRRGKSFIAINCAALPDNLLESELFGHEKGSFTGAIQRQIGKFELSDGGTILLDEISEMSLNMQTKLLRVLQECEVYRVGGNKPIPLNLRVVASTNRDLYRYMKEGNFREDLYYRINVIPIHVPALRERGDDMITLSDYFLDEFSRIHGRKRIKLDELARYKILNYPWHGNVRELRNSMERAVLVGNFDQIVNEDLVGKSTVAEVAAVPDRPGETGAPKTESAGEALDLTLDEVEKRVIFETLRRCKGNRTKTAAKLGISLRTLRNKLKAFRLEEEGIMNPAEDSAPEST
ncbi:MAG: sigma-54-dependent Fis family transcriptional regulator [Deltaproteobacteria bacterium]|nr:sigma-54-dependent Fis family transcriptional regulator [Deltaproteobacteria bacterium]